jgi:hypothetical protein
VHLVDVCVIYLNRENRSLVDVTSRVPKQVITFENKIKVYYDLLFNRYTIENASRKMRLHSKQSIRIARNSNTLNRSNDVFDLFFVAVPCEVVEKVSTILIDKHWCCIDGRNKSIELAMC